jgi:hypothetical protein
MVLRIVLLVLFSRPLVGQSCPLRVARLKPNGMFEFRITLQNPSESPVRLTALHVRHTTLAGARFTKERREVVSPFQQQRLVVQPHQRITLTTLPTMDAIDADGTATASASCALLAGPGNGERVGL